MIEEIFIFFDVEQNLVTRQVSNYLAHCRISEELHCLPNTATRDTRDKKLNLENETKNLQ